MSRQYFQYYSYRRNPTGREFFVPARTLIMVKLKTSFGRVSDDGELSFSDALEHYIPISHLCLCVADANKKMIIP